nr:PREDICTED: protein phosphatase methylesterase 1 [Bemisia tabaci]
MSAFHKSFMQSKLPPLMEGSSGTLPPTGTSRIGRRQQKYDYAPVHWDKYFRSRNVVTVGGNKFCTYSNGDSGPLLVLLHGGGFSALTWALFSVDIVEAVECQVLAIDLRGHGDTETTADNDLTIETLSKDVADVINTIYPSDSPPIILVGHSMGGAVAVHVADLSHTLDIIGLVVIDVVEGTAMDALSSMQSFLRNRPKSFSSIEEAISWSVRNHQVRNIESAKVSVPGQIKNAATGVNLSAAGEVKSSRIIESSGSEKSKEDEVDFKAPEPAAIGPYTWRIDLCATEKYWSGWFQGLSKSFLKCPEQKLLILANVDRLDRDLTVGQMQGKFGMHVLPRCGHAVHEDDPDKVAGVIANFLVRNKFAEPTSKFIKLLPGC